ncbi:Queuosine biosynthesis protein [Fibrisoma limi BUZ 3]|uniref:S-adenosylmethionine:tRNA ribosyltransferase-isomerase n=1 Tax=Fibrisoma limi BUZ 3 TaxID=1185876 RepID=I2GMX1_9BACT|nr:S-adenosylmethionine:tRNA ribosyltransferase-isomerase [Fibrisoma limi]CCH55249.1 Queuosine biosynthesis protein [Fibrisoma limi BUZ 3]
MANVETLRLEQFQYELPDERIARFPLAQRDQSKLLVYRSGEITHTRFNSLPNVLPDGSFLVFNDTKVIPARLIFTRSTGAVIELFLLNPVPLDRPITLAMQDTRSVVWQCMVGNRKRWKQSETLQTILPSKEGDIILEATWEDYEQSTVRLSWQSSASNASPETFAQVIQLAGQIPLPPYLKRDVVDADRDTYQTVYSKQEGAVAAPTAGLHFTKAVFDGLAHRGFDHDYLTLHVGAGTFQPIKTDDVRQHHMHTEQVVYTQLNLRRLMDHHNQILPVGTTSMRALESLYWMGVKLLRGDADPFRLDQHYAYQIPPDEQPTVLESLGAFLHYLEQTGQASVVAHTGIYITPGYTFKLCKGIITNFHQPGSTLILLVAALIGEDWRRVYNEAINEGYRFLSYGDSSLLLP